MNITKTKHRQSIANKVTSKKAEKGYTLSEEKCTDCDMNLLMSSTGKSECKVCPAIKKWVQRKNDNNNTNTAAVKKDNDVDVRDEVVVVEEKTMEKEEMRDDPEEDINPSINTSVSVESLVEHFENIKVVQETATSNTNTLTSVGSTDSDDTDAIRERARQIIMNARNGNMWDDNNDDDSDLSEAEEEEEEVEGESEYGDDFDNKSSSTDFSTSAENVDIKTTFSSDSMEDAFLQQRAAAIINQARMNLLTNSDDSDGSEDDSTSMDEVEGKGDETESLLAPESSEEVVDETEAGVNPSSSSAEEETNTGMELHDAAIIIQSTTRGFLAKKQVLGLMFREYEEETNLDEFETLGVNNPTEETDDDEKEEDDQYVDVDISVDKQEDTISEPEMLEPEPQQEEKLESVDVHVQSEAAVQLAPVAPESESLETSERFDTIDEMVIHDINQMKNAISPVVQEMKKALNSSQQKLSSTDVGKTAKSRGFFAELACKFDDAVSGALGRAVSCNMDVDSMLGFGEEYDELIEQGRAKYDAQLMLLVMQGWIDSHKPCPRCNKNFMLNPEDGDMMCAGCDDVGMINPDLTPAETYAPPSSQLVAMPEHLGCHNDWVDDAPVVTHHSPLPVMQAPVDSAHCNQAPVAPVDELSHANDDMENSSGDANVSKQLQDAKLRIEDAKKFIVSRSSNNHRMTPTGAHTAASPSRSVLGNMIPKHPASNQMSSPSYYSQTYNNGMGSLMSAESHMTPGGTPNSGYRTQ